MRLSHTDSCTKTDGSLTGVFLLLCLLHQGQCFDCSSGQSHHRPLFPSLSAFSFFFFLSLGRKTPGGALSHCLPEVKSLSVHSHSHLHPVRQTVLFVLRWLSECFSDKSKRMSWYVCVVYSALPLIVGTFLFCYRDTLSHGDILQVLTE